MALAVLVQAGDLAMNDRGFLQLSPNSPSEFLEAVGTEANGRSLTYLALKALRIQTRQGRRTRDIACLTAPQFCQAAADGRYNTPWRASVLQYL